MSPATRLAIEIVRLYKQVVSPWLPPAFRFTTTCSEYANDSLAEYGLFRGTRLALGRLLRCHPLHAGGFDPLT